MMCSACRMSNYCDECCHRLIFKVHRDRCTELTVISPIAKAWALGTRTLSTDVLSICLEAACTLGRLLDMQRLIAAGVDISLFHLPLTVLHLAAAEGHHRLVKALVVQNGVLVDQLSPNTQSTKKWPALFQLVFSTWFTVISFTTALLGTVLIRQWSGPSDGPARP